MAAGLDARRVWVAAGGRCTFCKEFLADDETTGQSVFTGQLAHIVGATTEKGSPRGASSMPLAQRALPHNPMLLCPGEHKVIDTFAHWSTYDEDELRAFKEQHECDIHELTGLLRKPKSTVIRVSGDVRGPTVSRPHGRQLTVTQQAIGLQRRFPSERRPLVKAGTLVWSVTLRPTPMSVHYTVGIRYAHRQRPNVTVLAPTLETRPYETATPHLPW